MPDGGKKKHLHHLKCKKAGSSTMSNSIGFEKNSFVGATIGRPPAGAKDMENGEKSGQYDHPL